MIEEILRREYLGNIKDSYEKETMFIEDANNNYEKHINDYINLKDSYDGYYLCTDLMKDTFEFYNASRENRFNYNLAVHNSASVLTETLFYRKIKEVKKLIILTGVPGSGKTTLLNNSIKDSLKNKDTLIFEGSIITPTIFDKIDEAYKYNVNVSIILVNAQIELCKSNVIKRIQWDGRGSYPDLMARMSTQIPNYLKLLHEKYPNIELTIYNKLNNDYANLYKGFNNLNILEKGDYDYLVNLIGEFTLNK